MLHKRHTWAAATPERRALAALLQSPSESPRNMDDAMDAARRTDDALRRAGRSISATATAPVPPIVPPVAMPVASTVGRGAILAQQTWLGQLEERLRSPRTPRSPRSPRQPLSANPSRTSTLESTLPSTQSTAHRAPSHTSAASPRRAASSPRRSFSLVATHSWLARGLAPAGRTPDGTSDGTEGPQRTLANWSRLGRPISKGHVAQV